jgi:DNA-binding GntR family transcriptional regulator
MACQLLTKNMTQDLQSEHEALDTDNLDDATSRTALMYEQIVSSIVEHRISPGTRFREERLADLFEVSRTQVRKVLQRLEHEGLVAKQPRKGVTVAAPTKEETKDIFEARRLIEPWIVAQLCNQCSPNKVNGLKKIVREENQARQKGERHLAVRLSGEFHRALAQAVGNRALIKTMDELTLRTCLAILGNKASTHVTCRDDEHQKIVQAIETNDTKTASKLMLSHLQHIENSLEYSDKSETVDVLDELLIGLPLISRKSNKK